MLTVESERSSRRGIRIDLLHQVVCHPRDLITFIDQREHTITLERWIESLTQFQAVTTSFKERYAKRRKRLNSVLLAEPQPSAILRGADVAALRRCDAKLYSSSGGRVAANSYTPTA